MAVPRYDRLERVEVIAFDHQVAKRNRLNCFFPKAVEIREAGKLRRRFYESKGLSYRGVPFILARVTFCEPHDAVDQFLWQVVHCDANKDGWEANRYCGSATNLSAGDAFYNRRRRGAG